MCATSSAISCRWSRWASRGAGLCRGTVSIRWWGVEAAAKDLVDRPEMVDAAMTRLVDGYIAMLDQWEALNLLTRNDDNTRIGSGGYGYTGALPASPTTRSTPGRTPCGAPPPRFSAPSRPGCTGTGAQARDALAGALGPDLLRLLRAAGCQDGHPAPGSQLAQASDELPDQDRLARCATSVQIMSCPANRTPQCSQRTPGGPEQARQDLVDFLDRARLPRRNHPRGHLHRPATTCSPVGLGAQDGGREDYQP